MPTSLAPVTVVARSAERPFTGPMLFATLAAIAAAFVRLSGLDHAGVSFCYFKTMTGHACMTCGSTRAFGHLAHFDLLSAFAIQPLVTSATLALILWGVADAFLLLTFSKRTRLDLQKKTRDRLTLVAIVLAAANWIYLLAIGA